MFTKPKMSCKIDPKTGEYSCDKPNIKGKCSVAQKSMQGGVNVLGNGANFGRGNTDIRCDDKHDMKRALQKKYPNYDIDIED